MEERERKRERFLCAALKYCTTTEEKEKERQRFLNALRLSIAQQQCAVQNLPESGTVPHVNWLPLPLDNSSSPTRLLFNRKLGLVAQHLEISLGARV